MLKVYASIGKSPIHGLGLFLNQPAKKGQLVWQFNPEFDQFFSAKQLGSLDPLQLEKLLDYCFFSPDTDWIVLCCDDSRFINFASNGHKPTLELSDEFSSGERNLVASHDLEVGYELTVGPETDKDYKRKIRNAKQE